MCSRDYGNWSKLNSCSEKFSMRHNGERFSNQRRGFGSNDLDEYKDKSMRNLSLFGLGKVFKNNE